MFVSFFSKANLKSIPEFRAEVNLYASFLHRHVSQFAAFLCELTGFNVVKEDPDVAVSVGPDLLMVEAKSMKNFMLHNFIVHAACFLQGQVLSPILTAHIGPAPKM